MIHSGDSWCNLINDICDISYIDAANKDVMDAATSDDDEANWENATKVPDGGPWDNMNLEKYDKDRD